MNYDNQEYHQLNLAGEDIEEAEFYHCTFYRCSFQELHVKNCSFINCTFENCVIINNTFKYSDAVNNTFKDCLLIGIDWCTLTRKNQITLPFHTLHNCALKYNYFMKLKLDKFNFTTNILEGSFFENCSLIEADFSGCCLKEAAFTMNNLSKADFRYATDYFINVQENNVRKAKFSYPEVIGLLKGTDIIIE
jgi:fluoroquinolone resistance protein